MEIWFANITYRTHKRGKAWNNPEIFNGIVVKGTDNQIKNNDDTKRRIYQYTLGKSKGFKADLNKIEILSIEKIHSLGRGFKE